MVAEVRIGRRERMGRRRCMVDGWCFGLSWVCRMKVDDWGKRFLKVGWLGWPGGAE